MKMLLARITTKILIGIMHKKGSGVLFAGFSAIKNTAPFNLNNFEEGLSLFPFFHFVDGPIKRIRAKLKVPPIP